MAEDFGAGSKGAEELTFSAEQLAVIYRWVTTRLAATSVPTSSVLGGADLLPTSIPSTLPSSEHGKFLFVVARQACRVGYIGEARSCSAPGCLAGCTCYQRRVIRGLPVGACLLGAT